jgi:hypothetical protein
MSGDAEADSDCAVAAAPIIALAAKPNASTRIMKNRIVRSMAHRDPPRAF